MLVVQGCNIGSFRLNISNELLCRLISVYSKYLLRLKSR